MDQGWGSLEEGDFIFPSSTGWVLATVYILLGCVKATMNLGTGGSIPNQMIAGPGFPRSSQALRSRACRWVGPEIYPNHWMLPLQANMFWADAGDDLKSI